MLINRVVLNASPLICLFKSGLANLLPALFQDIIVPMIVVGEVSAKGRLNVEGQELLAQDWIRPLADIPIDPLVFAWGLGNGESAVLSFATNNPAYWAIVDDKEARRCALSVGCHFMGTVGIIVLASEEARSPLRENASCSLRMQDCGSRRLLLIKFAKM